MTRTITTAAELAALPVGSVVRNLSRGITAERITDESGAIPGNSVRFPWGDLWSAGSYLVVLHDPSDPAPAPSVVPEAAVATGVEAAKREALRAIQAVPATAEFSWPHAIDVIIAAALPHLTARPAPAWDEDAVRDEAQAAAARVVAPYTPGPMDPLDVQVTDAILAVVREHLPVKPSREAVARALYDHWRRGSVEVGPWETATEHLCGVFHGKADAVLSLLPGRSEAEVKAEALRESADWLAHEYGNDGFPGPELHARADRLAAEGGANRG